MTHYPAYVDGDDRRGYDVVFPDLPGCTSAGPTLSGAVANAAAALRSHIELTLEAGVGMPEPGSFDDPPPPWLDGEDVTRSVRVMVPAATDVAAPPSGGRGPAASRFGWRARRLRRLAKAGAGRSTRAAEPPR